MDPFERAPDPATAFAPPSPPTSLPPPEVAVTAAPPAGRRPRKARAVGVLAAIAVLAGGAVVVAKNIQSNSGGFGSPEEAVKALFAAADQEDILGVVDVMRPGERSMLRDTLLPIEQEMERLDVLGKNVDMHKLPGLQVTVNGVTTSTEPLSDRVAVVTLTGGTMTTNSTFADLPLGKVLRDQIKPPADAGPSTTELNGEKLATVKEDGRWYVSLGYTIAEAARTSAGKPAPDFGHPIPAVGADTPEGAVTGLATAISKLDLSAAIGTLAPGEFGALQDYGPLFIPDAQKAIDQWKADNGVTLKITQGTAKVERHGSTADVSFDSTTIAATWGSNSVTVAVDAKNCTTVDSDIDGTKNSQHVCIGDATKDTVDIPADVKPILDRLKSLSLRSVAVEENGHWFVAPIRTLFDVVGQVLGAFKTTDDITTVQKWLGSVLTDAVDGGILTGTTGGSSDGSGTDTTDPGTDTTDDTTIDTTGDTADEPLSPALAAFDTAFRAHQQSGDTPEQTLQAMSDDGSIPDGLTFLDTAGTPLPAGTFTDVIGVESDDGGQRACMIFSDDSSIPGFSVPCP